MIEAISNIPSFHYSNFTVLPFHNSTIPYFHYSCCSSHSYFQSGSSGCFRSHSGRRLRTSGKVSKLYSGGGGVVEHSSVQASQGSSPAGAPRRSDHSTLATKQSTPAT